VNKSIYIRQILIIFAETKLWGDGTGILDMSVWFLDRSESVRGMSISNAILWTHFVTPRGDQTQQDQTKWVSYHKKEQSEESEDNSGLVGLYTSMWDCKLGGTCEGWNKLSMPLRFSWRRDWLACPVPNQCRISVTYRICWFGMDLLSPIVFRPSRISRLDQSQAHSLFVAACTERGMWTSCWWLSLLRLGHLGIHHDLVNMLFCWSQVVLSEGHDFCCNRQEAVRLSKCEIGEQGGFWS